MIERRWSPFVLVVGAALGALLAALAVPIAQRERIVRTDAAPLTTGAAAEARAGDPAGATPDDRTSGTGAATGDAPAPAGDAEAAPGGVATASTSPGAARASGDTATRGGGAVRGVTGDAIRIGVGIPDLGVVSALGPKYDDGDPRAMMAAVLDDWRRSGAIPVHGRDVQFFYRSYDIVGTEQQYAACTGWATDDRVFALVAVHDYWAAAECPTARHGIPTILNDPYPQRVFDASKGLLFTLPLSIDSMLRNWAHWMVERGIVTAKSRIGIYYWAGQDRKVVEDSLIAELARLGHADRIVTRMTTDNISTGSSQDVVAAQQFRARGVDVAILVVGAINQTNFQQAADTQRYRPTYVGGDFLYTTNDAAAGTFLPQQYDGTKAMTSLRFGELNAGMGLSPDGRRCVDNYRRFSGRTVTYEALPAEWMALMQSCDVSRVLLEALRGAGRDLDTASFVSALERIDDRPMALQSNVTFGPGRHAGTSQQRTLVWHGDCACWKATGAFAPLWVR